MCFCIKDGVFIDPACGCGNFLIVTYRELRALEIEILKMKRTSGQLTLDISSMLKVSVDQFYGIELDEFPCQIARTGMWLMDHQMNQRTSDIFGLYLARLPLTQSASIVNANALEIKWEDLVAKSDLDYILGNPPFNGARTMSEHQKNDMFRVFGERFKGAGELDYVCAWYMKAAVMSEGTQIRCAFVSTNSITQGEQPAILWKPLMARGVRINFGVRTFRWDNEGKGKAAVHCVIAGFSHIRTDGDLNQYLLDAPSVFIERRSRPPKGIPGIGIGNKPVDGGNYLFTDDEKRAFLEKEPGAAPYFRKWMGSDEFINDYTRHCLLLRDCPAEELRRMPECMSRVAAVRDFRMSSRSAPTRKLADTPLSFHVENMPAGPFIAIPKVSSEKRAYIPIGFLGPDTLASDLLFVMPGASLFHFGILTSNVHMAWTRTVCGRLKSDYRYSKDIVFNNFPWPEATAEQKESVGALAAQVLTARENHAPASLADLYDPLAMPKDLWTAHKNLDRAVMGLYGFSVRDTTEESCAAALMRLHQDSAKA